jgi:hypothetical protein
VLFGFWWLFLRSSYLLQAAPVWPNSVLAFDLLRQASEQYFTSFQFLAQFLRQLISRPQIAQILVGNEDLLPLKLISSFAGGGGRLALS